ncbi:MAG: PBP1A family penicillin-binding protein [bacterium]
MGLRFIRNLFLIISLFFCTIFGLFFYLLESNSVDVSALQRQVKKKPTIVLDDQGNEFARFELDKQDPLFFDQIPPIIINAFLAAEDRGFFSHYGLSLRGVLRSALVNIIKFRKVQGASTITQQVTRSLFLNHDRTWKRKIQEMFLAVQLERQMSKEQILELYLNNVYFGRGTYGIQAACKRFWNKTVTDISIDEAAVLGAVAKSARYYSPLNNLAAAKKRRNIVLGCMHSCNFITEEELKESIKKPLKVQNYISGDPIKLYIQESVRTWAEEKWGRLALYNKGLKIKITINQEMQAHAQEAFATAVNGMRKLYKAPINGGMVVVQASTGAIKSLIGGLDFHASQYNRAFQAYRQLGSSFKPLLYALAVKSGFDMDDVFMDEPTDFVQKNGDIWSPHNWHHRFEGRMTLLRALTMSNNIISVKLLIELGAGRVIDWARKFGINRGLIPVQSLALGVMHATPKENVAAFNTFANNGVYVEPFLIEWVKDQWGRKLWVYEPVTRQLIDSKVNSKMVKALTYRMELARHNYEHWLDCESIGKSGTNSDATTTWFVGATPEYSAAVYVGRDDNKSMGANVYASSTAFPIWFNFFRNIKSKKKNFYFDPELEETSINWWTGRETSDELDSGTMKILK